MVLVWGLQAGAPRLQTTRQAENGTQESSFNTRNLSDVSWKRGTEERFNNGCQVSEEGNWPFSSTTEKRQKEQVYGLERGVKAE